SGLKFNELEFTIAHGLLKGMLERVIIIEKYTVTKRNDVRFKMINVACNRIIQNITMKAPELKYIVRALN
ncbi:TPA: hypothetical protein GF663_25125, partial [Escherichia coli]|nr:hypothetical protein [Escherichia coli]